MKIDSHFGGAQDLVEIFKCDSDVISFDLPVFPLKNGQFLCTQSSLGMFTHFQHSSTTHAVDFRCPIGTPVLSVCNGVVLSAGGCRSSLDNNDNDLVINGGIHVSNLFAWNGVVIKSDLGFIFEYIHIHHEGILVKEGDRVKEGDILCLSGQSGFCPEPHLHIEAHKEGKEQSSVRLTWKGLSFQAGFIYGSC